MFDLILITESIDDQEATNLVVTVADRQLISGRFSWLEEEELA